VLHVAYGEVDLAVNPTAADVIRLVKVPAGALIIGGEMWMDEIDTGTEELDIDFGWAANGGSSETFTTSTGITYTNAFGSASSDGIRNSGVMPVGDAQSTYEPHTTTGEFYKFGIFTTGPKYCSRDTIFQGTVIADAAAGGTGKIWMRIEYLVVKF
jgi:hypothetical protein